MKKLLMLTLVTVFSLTVANAQGHFKIGAVAGIPGSDAGDISDFMLGVDVYYMFAHNDDAILNFGLMSGLRNYFIDDIEFEGISVETDDALFLPLAASGRVKLFGAISGGVDAGYAFGLTDYLDGGFYVRPLAGIDLLDILEINVSYEIISDDAEWSAFMIGALLEL